MSRHRGRMLHWMIALLATGIMIASAGCSLGGGSIISRPPPLPTAASSPPLTPIPTQPPVPPSSATHPPQVASALGPPPKDCAITPPPQTMSVTNFGGGFSGAATFQGGSPAWELGFGSDGTLAAQGLPYPSSKIMWVVGPNINQPVTLSGRDLRSGALLWFEMYPPNYGGGKDYFTTAAVLDPTAPNRGSTNNSTGHWNIWGIGIVVGAASCYQLDVTSASGSWHTDFAAGTVAQP